MIPKFEDKPHNSVETDDDNEEIQYNSLQSCINI